MKRGVTEKGSRTSVGDARPGAVGVPHTIKRWGRHPRERPIARKRDSGDPRLPRKAPRGGGCHPYRKPTQVGEEKILRRLRELSPRNSANCHRNFGRRWARARVGTCSPSAVGSQRNGGCDCLPKTQDSANTSSGRIGSDACPVPEG